MATASASFLRISSEKSPYHSLPSTSFKKLLGGRKAFYEQPDYVERTRQDLTQTRSLPVHYTWSSENKIVRIAKQIFAILFFPLGIHQLLHNFMGKIALVPSSSPQLLRYSKNYANSVRSHIPLTDKWKFKRITIQVDGYKIDAMIAGTASTLNNGRWVLSSLGNAQFYEEQFFSKSFTDMLGELKSNALVFNYPGVGASTGWPNRKAMEKAYRAMLNFLEDQENGIGAKEIIGYSYSIGAGVQSDALKKHPLKKEVKYVFVKGRSFSTLYKTAATLTNRLLAFLVKIFGWNMDSAKVSKKLQAPEIILQTAKVSQYEEIKDSSKVINDGIIAAQASLAKALLDDKACPTKNKVFIGIPEGHNEELTNPEFLAKKIESLLETSSSS
ncbi:CPn0927/CPn0928 family alpha/beta hydrolase fold protein [Parachlamydia sp. AcF125]|uniref:CPn0927/CPn0928 family alpha/beta hydrolase fold protein n=1 Tax=Parachlamydia sp. AcF125 TaxID=2795736 RepID=UPI001BC929FB|nr:CPn0927/CPn0928 family alpha/beta hydrolase fold protein [Parachlamydia sp. AcF125]MBS4167980.1 hypothetical protein [Parachlamydia sp. AcF125]